LLDRPRDAPWRTALGAALLTWVFVIFLAGSADRVDVLFGLDYSGQIWAYRVLVWVLPLVALVAALRVCFGLQAGERVESERKRAEHEAAPGPEPGRAP
jgi:ubiquinol-cytochrome c reductase cytochrome b subunit